MFTQLWYECAYSYPHFNMHDAKLTEYLTKNKKVFCYTRITETCYWWPPSTWISFQVCTTLILIPPSSFPYYSFPYCLCTASLNCVTKAPPLASNRAVPPLTTAADASTPGALNLHFHSCPADGSRAPLGSTNTTQWRRNPEASEAPSPSTDSESNHLVP